MAYVRNSYLWNYFLLGTISLVKYSEFQWKYYSNFYISFNLLQTLSVCLDLLLVYLNKTHPKRKIKDSFTIIILFISEIPVFENFPEIFTTNISKNMYTYVFLPIVRSYKFQNLLKVSRTLEMYENFTGRIMRIEEGIIFRKIERKNEERP